MTGNLTSNILFGCSVRDSIRAEFCPFLSSILLAEGPAGNLTAKSMNMFHLFFSMNHSISTSKIWSVTQKNGHPLRDGETLRKHSVHTRNVLLSLVIHGNGIVILLLEDEELHCARELVYAPYVGSAHFIESPVT